MLGILLQLGADQVVTKTTLWVEKAKDFIFTVGPKLIYAIIIYIVGKWAIKWINTFLTKILSLRNFDSTLKTFLLSLVKISLTILLFITIAGIVGIPITGFAAIMAGVGLGIGAALNGSLGNVAGGVMIMIFKPFKVGDIIEAQGQTGGVKEIGIVNTIITTGENKTVILPNGALSTGVITNYNIQGFLLVNILYSIDGSQDIDQARAIAVDVMKSCPEVLEVPAPSVVINKIKDGSIELGIKPYTTQANMSKVQATVLEGVKKAFDANGIIAPVTSYVVKQA